MPADSYLLVGLVGWTGLFLAVGLWPFRFGRPRKWRMSYWPRPINGPLNFLGFLPFGLLIGEISFVSKPIITTAIFCMVLSLAVELAQQCLPPRHPSLSDLVLNTMGGIAGAYAHGVLSGGGC